MRIVLAIIGACSLAGCSSDATADKADVPSKSAAERRISDTSLPMSVKGCATDFDNLKGAGFTLVAAERLENRCQAAMADAPRRCAAFLAAAGRTGFKAAALIKSGFADNGMQPLAWARENANANRSVCEA